MIKYIILLLFVTSCSCNYRNPQMIDACHKFNKYGKAALILGACAGTVYGVYKYGKYLERKDNR